MTSQTAKLPDMKWQRSQPFLRLSNVDFFRLKTAVKSFFPILIDMARDATSLMSLLKKKKKYINFADFYVIQRGPTKVVRWGLSCFVSCIKQGYLVRALSPVNQKGLHKG